MFEFIDFVLKLWYNSPPENTLKIVACSGVSSGCLVYYVCKFLEKRNKSMDEEKLDPRIGVGDKIKLVKKSRGKMFWYGASSRSIGEELVVREIDATTPSYKCENDCGMWWFHPSEVELVASKESPKFKVGDYAKVTSKKYDWIPEMDILLGKTIKIIKTNYDYRWNEIVGFSPLSKSSFKDREFGWVFNPLALEPSTLEAYNKDNDITFKENGKTMEPTEWTLFTNEIPTRRDVIISDDGKSWAYKTQEETKLEPKGSELMKTETPKQTKIKLNWRPITNTEGLEDGESYLTVDSDGELIESKYSEDSDCDTSDNFNSVSTAAFYVPMSEVRDLIEIPSIDDCKKVLKEEESQGEYKTITMTDLVDNFSSYSKEKQEKLVAFLQSKGIKV